MRSCSRPGLLRRLELEITETALVRDLNRALATLRRIKMLGVRIAMDDFGTGYSSLSNLRAFPFDKIKIDGSFIKSVNVNEQAAAIVRSVLGLGRGLGLPVLAEGVETRAEFEFLKMRSAMRRRAICSESRRISTSFPPPDPRGGCSRGAVHDRASGGESSVDVTAREYRRKLRSKPRRRAAGPRPRPSGRPRRQS